MAFWEAHKTESSHGLPGDVLHREGPALHLRLDAKTAHPNRMRRLL
jgi:hypothetical protein